MINCPNVVKYFPVSTTVNPVTHTALVAVKSASIIEIPLYVAFGRSNSKVPPKIKSIKLITRSRPGCFIWLGAGHKNSKHDIHSSKFTINEEAMKYGASLLAYLTISILSK